jgi:hypothetical protein
LTVTFSGYALYVFWINTQSLRFCFHTLSIALTRL